MKYIRRTSKNITEDFAYNLLADRGIINEENKQPFFFPTSQNEEDPMLLDNIMEGIELLKKYLHGGTIYLPVD